MTTASRIREAVGVQRLARAWRHYLALRFDPEPELRLQRDSIVAALAGLDRARRPR